MTTVSKVIRRGTQPEKRDEAPASDNTVTVDEGGEPTSDAREMYAGSQVSHNKAGDPVLVRHLYSDQWLRRKAPDEPEVAYFD